MSKPLAVLPLLFVVLSCSGAARPELASEPAGKGPVLGDTLCLAGVAHRVPQNDPARFDAELARFQDLGVRTIRYDVDWVDVEKSEAPGVYELDWLEAMLGKLEAAHIRSIPLLAYGHPHYNGRTDGDRFYPTAPEPYAAYAAAVAKRFGTRLGPYEIWNEPNAGYRFFKPKEDPARYAAILDAATRAIHGACPECQTLFGGVFWHPEAIMGGSEFIAKTTAAMPGLWDRLDGLAVHPYAFYPPTGGPDSHDPPDVPMAQMLLEAVLAAGRTPSPPLWITEIGWPVQPQLDEAGQASRLVKTYALAARLGVRATCWYQLQDGPDHGQFPPEDDFGLLHYAPGGPAEGTPKRAYLAFQALSQLAGDAAFSRDRAAEVGLTGDQSAALLFRNSSGTRAVTILWNAFAIPGATVRVPLHKAGTASLFDAAGAPLPLTVEGDVAVVPVGDEPHFLVE